LGELRKKTIINLKIVLLIFTDFITCKRIFSVFLIACSYRLMVT